MSYYTRVPINDQGEVIVELSGGSGLQEVGAGNIIQDTKSKFDDIMNTVELCAQGFMESLSKIESAIRPQEASIEFGVSLSSEIGTVIAKASAEGTFKVTLVWKST